MEPTTATAAAPKKGLRRWIIALIIAAALIAGIWGYMAWRHNESMKAIGVLIDGEAAKAPSTEAKAKVSRLLQDTCGTIIADRDTRRQARKYASDMGITYERAVVDMALGQLRSMGYIN